MNIQDISSALNGSVCPPNDPLHEEKNVFLRQVQDLPRFPTVRFVHTLSAYTKLPGFLVILLLSFIPYLLGIPLALLSDDSIASHTSFWLRLNVFMITAGALILLDMIDGRIRDTVDEVVFPIQDPGDLVHLFRGYSFLYTSHWRHVLRASIIVPVWLTIVFFLGIPFHGTLQVFYALYALAPSYLFAEGVWVTIGLAVLAYEYSRCGSIRFNALHPVDTIGVRHLADLSTTWSFAFALEGLFILVGLWAAPWSNDNTQILFQFQTFWSGVTASFTLYTFVHPKLLIRRVVDRGRRLRALWFQQFVDEYEQHMNSITEQELELRERTLKLLEDYHEFFGRIARAPTSAMDFATVAKLVGSLLIPLLVFVVQNLHELQELWGSLVGGSS